MKSQKTIDIGKRSPTGISTILSTIPCGHCAESRSLSKIINYILTLEDELKILKDKNA